MPKRKHRIIIDTNLWISFLLTKDLDKLENIIGQNVTLLFSIELLEEFLEVAQRQKFRKYFTDKDIEKLLLHISEVAEFAPVMSIVNACRDAKDNFLLALAKDGKADHLITGDNDLLELKAFGKTKIVTATEYLSNS